MRTGRVSGWHDREFDGEERRQRRLRQELHRSIDSVNTRVVVCPNSASGWCRRLTLPTEVVTFFRGCSESLNRECARGTRQISANWRAVQQAVGWTPSSSACPRPRTFWDVHNCHVSRTSLACAVRREHEIACSNRCYLRVERVGG